MVLVIYQHCSVIQGTHFFLSDFTSPLVHVHICFLAHQVGIATTHALTGVQKQENQILLYSHRFGQLLRCQHIS